MQIRPQQIRPQKIARRQASSGVSHGECNSDVWPVEEWLAMGEPAAGVKHRSRIEWCGRLDSCRKAERLKQAFRAERA